MKNKFKKQALALVTVMALVISIFSISSIGVSADTSTTNDSVGVTENAPQLNPYEAKLLPGDLTSEELKTATLDSRDIPSVITDNDIKKFSHVNRLYEQETDEYTVLFQNRDGSKTIYIFDFPVKKSKANGSFNDMSCEEILSSVKTSSKSYTQSTSILSIEDKKSLMSERLNEYKESLNITDKQSLKNEYKTLNVSSTGVITDIQSYSKTKISNESVIINSVSTTYSTMAGSYFIKTNGNNGKYLGYSGNNAIVTDTAEW